MNSKIAKILLFYFPDAPPEKRDEAAKVLSQLKEKEKQDRIKEIESHPLTKYIVENYPNVAKLKLPTPAQCEELKKEFPTDLIIATLQAMDNTKEINKKVYVHLTLIQWARNSIRNGWDSTAKKEQVYTRPEKRG